MKKHVNIPVATVGRITEAWIADEMIANGFTTVQGIASYVQPEDLVDALGISEDQAFAIVDKAKNA